MTLPLSKPRTNARLGLGGLLLGVLLLAATGATPPAADEPPIRHKFLAIDESRHQMIYVDQADPAKNWKVEFPAHYRDCQLVGRGRLLVSTTNGYREYDLATQKLAKEFAATQCDGADTARRLPDGRTIVGCNQRQHIVFYELDAQDTIVRTAEFPGKSTLRLMRLTPRGTMLFGANATHIIEADMKGTVLRDIALEKDQASYVYQILEKPDGGLLASSGYTHTLLELDKDGKVAKSFGGKAGPERLGLHFFAGFQVLRSGHIVQCNWTGHGPKDSAKGVQLVEFDLAGKIVWQWHDADLAGTIHGIIVLDDL